MLRMADAVQQPVVTSVFLADSGSPISAVALTYCCLSSPQQRHPDGGSYNNVAYVPDMFWYWRIGCHNPSSIDPLDSLAGMAAPAAAEPSVGAVPIVLS